MKLKCLGSSSSGNCYLLEAEKETLIIEAGIPFIDVKKALNFNLRKVAGCLISHRHNDHAKYLKDFLSSGIKVLALDDVFNSKDLRTKVFCKEILPLHGYIVGGFKVLALNVAHDVPCLGFLIEHQEMGRLLFITDTMMLEYRLPNLNHIMIEANYSDQILTENIESGIVHVQMRDRLIHSHMELQTTKEVLRKNDLKAVQEVILLHLSNNNSDGEQFSQEVRESSGKPTYIARSGFEIDLDKIPDL